MEEIERNFKNVKNKINENFLKQRICYRFSKDATIDQLENVFVFELETYNDQEFVETYAAGIYDVYRLRDRWKRDSTPHEIVTEKVIVILFDGSNVNPVMNILKNISENYEEDERTYNDKDGDEIVCSCRLLKVAQYASGFDTWVVLKSLVNEITELKLVKTARGLISLSFKCGFKLINTVEVPQYVKFTCTKSYKMFFRKNR